MQGRDERGQDGAQDGGHDRPLDRETRRRAFDQQRAYLRNDDTGTLRSIPQRPSSMARLNQPPATHRVARPQRGSARPASCRRRMLSWSIVAIVCIVLAFFLGYAAINLVTASNANAGAAAKATDFLQALNNQNYGQAYNDLGPAITIPVTQDDFTEQALVDDRCFGTVTRYSEIANSAVQTNAQSITFDYSITRSKLAHPYTLRLQLQQDTNSGHWQIGSFGDNNALTPAQPSCS